MLTTWCNCFILFLLMKKCYSMSEKRNTQGWLFIGNNFSAYSLQDWVIFSSPRYSGSFTEMQCCLDFPVKQNMHAVTSVPSSSAHKGKEWLILCLFVLSYNIWSAMCSMLILLLSGSVNKKKMCTFFFAEEEQHPCLPKQMCLASYSVPCLCEPACHDFLIPCLQIYGS